MTISTTFSKKTISTSDTLYVRVIYMGKQLLNVQLCQISSLSQAVNMVREYLGGVNGLVKISLRNASQGWSTEHWCAA